MSELMDIIHDCENRLGWSAPVGAVLWQARAAEHRKLSIAMERQRYTEADLRLALAYCIRRKQAITSPLELIGLVEKARDLAAVPDTTLPLDDQVEAALQWEASHPDADSHGWAVRFIRTAQQAGARADVLDEWRAAGRG